jgi:ribonuclease HI
MRPEPGDELVLVHVDESCLGNGQEPPTPGGAGGLVEVHARGTRLGADGHGAGDANHAGAPEAAVERHDFFLSEPDTTNNRMALRSALTALELLEEAGRRRRVVVVSDAIYLVKGMREWVAAWRARGWRRKGGRVENLDLWQRLAALAERHEVRWEWIRGHAGHAKNEYANHLAMRAAEKQLASGGFQPSRFAAWLEREREQGRYRAYDADADPARWSPYQ